MLLQPFYMSVFQTFLNKPELICLHTVKWSQVLLFNSNKSIQHDSFVCTPSLRLKSKSSSEVAISEILKTNQAVMNQERVS